MATATTPAKRAATNGKAEDEKVISQLQLDRIVDNVVSVPIVGLTPLIPHRWSEKSLKMMRDKQMSESGTLKPQRTPKNPDEEAEASCYWLPDGTPGMPATAFKSAIVEAARYYQGVTITMLKRVIFVEGEGPDMLARIISSDKVLREDTPRNSGGTADLRYRFAFYPWSAILRVRFMPSVLPPTSVFNLVDAAGRGGVGDWRPGSPKSNTGIFGTFRIDDAKLDEVNQ